jgi:hypothetical protein
MDFLELLDLPNNTELSYKQNNLKKENQKVEVKNYVRVKSEDTRDDYFMRILKKVKLATTEDKKEIRTLSPVEELKTTGYQPTKRKYYKN